VPRKTPGSSPPRYSIATVAGLTGLSIETLRAWEHQHQVIRPARGSRGRLYSGNDVKRLQLLAAAVNRGRMIEDIASLPDEELEAIITMPLAPRDEPVEPEAAAASGELNSTLLAALHAFDGAGVERELLRLSLMMKPRDLVRGVLFRFLRHVGDDWPANKLGIAQEHLLSGAVRSVLGTMVRVYSKENVPKRLLFVTPAGERHEFGILAAAMLAAAGGLGVVYMGADLPARLIVDAAARSGVDVVVLGLIYSGATRAVRGEVEYIADHLPGKVELWVGGQLAFDLDGKDAGRHIVRLEDFDALEQQLVGIGATF
jgi:MerR family transcriptional regulator, light-induced transcriptional regulator